MKTLIASLSHPLFFVSYLVALSLLAVAGAVNYLGTSINYELIAVSVSLIFLVYVINLIYDLKEDFVNRGESAFFVLKHEKILWSIIAVCIAVFVTVVIRQKLSTYYFIILMSGIFYSVPLFPWYNRGLKLYRFKSIPLVKNIIVASIWGTSLFVVPIIATKAIIPNKAVIIVLIITAVVSSFINTVFNDILDVSGDAVAGHKTLPFIFGEDKTYTFLTVINSAWFVTALYLYFKEIINIGHIVFIFILTVYSFLYITGYRTESISKKTARLISECDLLLIGTGLFFL